MEWIDTFSDFLTPAIAIIATYIAIQQYRTNKTKLKLALFDKRFQVWQGVKDYLDSAIRDFDVSTEDIFKFKHQTRDAFFLFGNEVELYITKLISNGAELRKLNKDYEKLRRQGEKSEEVNERTHVLVTWFTGQFEDSKWVFRKYLRINR